jgi:hypothetical protein
MEENNGNGSRRNGNNRNGKKQSRNNAPVNASMTNLLATRPKLPRAAKQAHINSVAAKAAAMAAEREETKAKKAASGSAMAVNQSSRHAITRKAPRKNTPYARSSKNKANNISRPLHGLSFGKSTFKMKNFKKKAAPSYTPHFAPSSFVPLNQQQAFQLQMNEAVARQAAAYRQRQANITQHRRNGAKRGWAKRRDEAAAALAAASAAVERAEMDIAGQERSSSGASNNQSAHAHQVLALALEAQRTALDEYTALQRALDDLGSTSTVSSSSAANYANENNGFAYAARANNRVARANNGSASAASSASSTNASF